MAVPDRQNQWGSRSHLAEAESSSLAGRDIDGGGVKSSNDAAPARQDTATNSQHRPQDADVLQAPSAPPVLQLPRPERIHHGWDASNIPTAKCDMCHRQRCGTIQKCYECKLSVCKACAYANLLQDDGRHVLNPDEVDWTATNLSKARMNRSSRGGRVRGSRGGRAGGTTRGQGRGRGCGGRGIQPQAASSRSTSSSSLSPASPRTDTVSPDIDGKREEDRDRGGEEQMLSREDDSRYHRPTKRARDPISPAAFPLMEAQDVAHILAGMPRMPPNSEGAFMKRRKYSLQQSPLNNVLPPVCSVPDPRQSGYLPSLKTLHPPVASDIVPLETPTLTRGLSPPHATPVAYMGHASTPRSSFVFCKASQSHGKALLAAQSHASRVYQHPPTAPHYYSSGEPAVFYNTPSLSPAAAQRSVQESLAVAQPQFTDASFVGNSHGKYPPLEYGEYMSSYRGPLVYSSLDSQPDSSSQVGVYGSPAELKNQRDMTAMGTVKEQGTKLKEEACEIKRSEHGDWPLTHCLRLAASRSWTRILAKGPGVDRQDAFERSCAATNFAILDIGLAEKDNAARS